MFNIDEINVWAPMLLSKLYKVIPKNHIVDMERQHFEHMSDAANFLLDSREHEINVFVKDWLSAQQIITYHGSRLTPEELRDVLDEGLLPLDPARQILRTLSILKENKCSAHIDIKQQQKIDDWAEGRIGQVHMAISRTALLERYPHYAKYGSEFGKVIAQYLEDKNGLNALANHGRPLIISLKIPGDITIKAANPYTADNPLNLVREVIELFALWLHNHHLNSRSFPNTDWRGIDCCLIFNEKIPADWIAGVEYL
ncbi:MAG: hypothetical protein V4485_05740 [Pseudomonadota bacterium]